MRCFAAFRVPAVMATMGGTCSGRRPWWSAGAEPTMSSSTAWDNKPQHDTTTDNLSPASYNPSLPILRLPLFSVFRSHGPDEGDNGNEAIGQGYWRIGSSWQEFAAAQEAEQLWKLKGLLVVDEEVAPVRKSEHL